MRARTGHGGTVNFSATVRPTNHLAIDLLACRRWLDVDDGTGGESRLFTAKVERIKATYTFDRRSYLRLIGQREATDRDPALYGFVPPIPDKDKAMSLLRAVRLQAQLAVGSLLRIRRRIAVVAGHHRPRNLEPLVLPQTLLRLSEIGDTPLFRIRGHSATPRIRWR